MRHRQLPSSLLVLVVLAAGCSAPQTRRASIDEDKPTPAELAAETTEVAYLSHDQVLVNRARPDEPVPPGGRILVSVRRSTPKRAEFDGIQVIVEDRGDIVLDQMGDRSSAPVICGASSWCNEQSFDVEKPVLGPLRVTVFDSRNGHRKEVNVRVEPGEG